MFVTATAIDGANRRRRTNVSPKRAAKTTSTKKTPRAKPQKPAPEARPSPATATPSPTSSGMACSRDARLPAPGTVLEKRDRHGVVRCACRIEEDGIRYEGTLYRSLSAAALAAAKDQGLKGRAQNGFVFWGLTKPARTIDPLSALGRAWERYASIAARAASAESKAAVSSLLGRHATLLERLRDTIS